MKFPRVLLRFISVTKFSSAAERSNRHLSVSYAYGASFTALFYTIENLYFPPFSIVSFSSIVAVTRLVDLHFALECPLLPPKARTCSADRAHGKEATWAAREERLFFATRALCRTSA